MHLSMITWFCWHIDVGFCAGCPRVAGDEEDNFDADDFDDEFPVKNHREDLDRNHDVNHVVFSLFLIKLLKINAMWKLIIFYLFNKWGLAKMNQDN